MFPVNEIHQAFLETLLRNVDGVAGTVHEQRGEDLYLTAAQNIPPPVIAIVTHVPHGKGMAGVAQVKKQPVQTCNLQMDDSGSIKPGAKAVNAQAAIACRCSTITATCARSSAWRGRTSGSSILNLSGR